MLRVIKLFIGCHLMIKRFDRTPRHILEESGVMWERMSWLVKSLEFRELSYGFSYMKD
jgi:hypothetical protein